jgi:hypothetical protein
MYKIDLMGEVPLSRWDSEAIKARFKNKTLSGELWTGFATMPACLTKFLKALRTRSSVSQSLKLLEWTRVTGCSRQLLMRCLRMRELISQTMKDLQVGVFVGASHLVNNDSQSTKSISVYLPLDFKALAQ